MDNIEKLRRDNYGTWCDDMKAVLLDRNVWSFVDGTEDALPTEASYRDKQKYKERQRRAFSSIYLSLSDEIKPLLTDIVDAKIAWEKIKDHFQPDSRARLVGLLDSFFNCRMGENEDVGLFAARLSKLIKQLKEEKHEIAELYKTFQLIRYLPHPYLAIVQSIYRWKNEDFTFDKALKELLAEESRLKQSMADQEKLALKVTVVKPKNTKTRMDDKISKPKNVKECKFCHMKNHVSSSCWKKNKRDKKLNVESSYVTEACISTPNPNSWICDTAATNHFCGNKSLFSVFKPMKGTKMSVAIGGVTCPIEGIGEVDMIVDNGGTPEKINLKEVMYVPKLRRNLIAGHKFDIAGATFIGKNKKIQVISKSGRKQIAFKLENGLYVLNPTYPENDSNVQGSLSTAEHNADIWHRRFNHVNFKYLHDTSKNDSVRGLPELKSKNFKCETCRISKQRRRSFKSLGGIRSKAPLELLHMDVCSIPKVSISGHRYFLSITDDFSRKVVVYPLKSKDEVFDCFTRFQKRAERFLNRKVLSVRTDQGLEFVHSKFSKFLEDQGIKAERTNTYSPEMDGVSEKFNCTALDGIKTMLKDSGLSDGFWSEALLCYVYTWNRTCHQGNKKTPFELYSGRKPSVKHFKIFGSKAYVGIPRQLRSKLQSRAKIGVMVGYALNTRGYRIWLPDQKKVIETINVTFEEKPRNSDHAVDSALEPPKSTNNFCFQVDRSDSDSEDEYQSNVKIEQVETPKEALTVTDASEKLTPLNELTWIRKAVPRKHSSKTDIYYNLEGSKTKLRSPKDAKIFCETNKIEFDPEFFDFSGKNKFSGVVKEESEDESEISEGNETDEESHASA